MRRMPMRRIAITGASGLVGTELVAALRERGDEVLRLVRRPATRPDEVTWDVARGRVDVAALEGLAAVVHLAGENIAGGLWTAARRRRIFDSRAEGTRQLAQQLAGLSAPPGVFVSASAIGYYGDPGATLVDEDSPPGTGFLAEVCQAWEAAAQPARGGGIRVVIPRIGLVMASTGGVLGRLLAPFRLGLGGVVGSGRQYMSWVSLADLIAALQYAIETEALAGPVNLVAPEPVTNAEFTRVLGKVLGRPTVIPLPAFAVSALMGEMGRELLLAGQRVSAGRLIASGFTFRSPDLESALRAELAA